MKDLFETPELIPQNVQSVLETFDEDASRYSELERILGLIKPMGYTFDYFIDGYSFGLRPIGIELDQLEGWDEI